jgi:signal transduction histidine kinase
MDQGTGAARPPSATTVPTAAEFQARIDELERTVRLREDLLAVAAHELRNPMHALLLQISAALVLARREASPALLQRLERVRHIVDMYVKRATVLLDFSRIHARGFELHCERCDLIRIVRDVADTFALDAGFNQSVLQLTLPATLPEILVGYWDRMAIEQIVSNLVSNALKFGNGRPVQVRLSGDGAVVRLEIQDQGIGIAAADRDRIFDRFEQALGSAERRDGFGIGLWLVRSLVRAHHGTIVVDSEPGQGSCFIVSLPLDARVADHKEAEQIR